MDTGTCSIIEAGLYRNGFNALGIDPPAACNITNDCPQAQRITPVILTEFGHNQDATIFNDTLQNCLKDYTKKYGVSWAMVSQSLGRLSQGLPSACVRSTGSCFEVFRF